MVVLDADVSKSTQALDVRRQVPERFVNVGIAEQNMMSIAAGMASCGMIPLVCSFSMLLSLRALDQFRQPGAYPSSTSSSWPTTAASPPGRKAPRTTPSRTWASFAPSRRDRPGPLRCRGNEGGAAHDRDHSRAGLPPNGPQSVPRVEGKPEVVKVGKGYRVEKARTWRSSPSASWSSALEAAEELAKEGIECQVVAMPSLKPIDADLIVEAARQTGAVVTAEEHSIYGGLGSAVAEVLGEHPPSYGAGRYQGCFAESAQWFELLDKYGLSVNDIIAACRETLTRK